MIPEFGNLCLSLALALALVQTVLPLVGAHTGSEAWMRVARPAALAQFAAVAGAFGILTYAFVVNDFSVEYVAQHSNSALPLGYRIAAVWGAHEGSLVLWLLVQALWTVAVAWASRKLPLDFASRVIGVLGFVSGGFLLFTIFTSNPFLRLQPAAIDGADLNPLLQDPGLAIHPPILYAGYVGFSVAFAFAIAAMLAGRSIAPGPAGRARGRLRLAFSDLGICARQLVGLLRVGLGWLVVLGPGGECLVHALARRHGADPLAGGDRNAGAFQELDAAARHLGIFPELAWVRFWFAREFWCPCMRSRPIRPVAILSWRFSASWLAVRSRYTPGARQASILMPGLSRCRAKRFCCSIMFSW